MDSPFLAFNGSAISLCVVFAIAFMNLISNILNAEKLEQVKFELNY